MIKMDDIKKNILDLQFQKYLIKASTSIVVAFTYLVGVFVSLIAKDIDLKNYDVVSILIGISIFVLAPCTLVFYRSTFHIKNILSILKNHMVESEKQK
jgi:hypothetical protein